MITGLISALIEIRWTAIKISAHRHGGDIGRCFSFSEERSAQGGHDSSRYLSAGAARSYWLRASDAHLAQAVPAIEQIIREGKCVIMESNRIVEYLKPDLYLIVLDPSVEDFKESARRFLGRSDACVEIAGRSAHRHWKDVDGAALKDKPLFLVKPPDFVTPELIQFVRTRLAGARSTRCGAIDGTNQQRPDRQQR